MEGDAEAVASGAVRRPAQVFPEDRLAAGELVGDDVGVGRFLVVVEAYLPPPAATRMG